MPRKPSHFFFVQWDRKRDIDGNLTFVVTDTAFYEQAELTRKLKKELKKSDYSLIAGPITLAECWELKKIWKHGMVISRKEFMK